MEKSKRALKQVIVVRKDLKMSPGKLAGQVAHAACGLIWEPGSYRASYVKIYNWMQEGQTKAVLRIDSEAELSEIEKAARAANLPVYPVRDAGHTQLEPGTFTCVGIGPEEESKLDAITGHLKLL